MALLDLLERGAPLDVHQVDKSQVAGAEHHDLAIGDVVLAIDAAATTHDTSRRTGRRRGRSGCQTTASP
jgi:hypothetical protein